MKEKKRLLETAFDGRLEKGEELYPKKEYAVFIIEKNEPTVVLWTGKIKANSSGDAYEKAKRQFIQMLEIQVFDD